MALSDIKFDEMPEELAKQFSNIGASSSLAKTSSDKTSFKKETNVGFRADDIISGFGVSKFNSSEIDQSSSI